MRVCDICRGENVMYTTYAAIKEDGGKQIELCYRCYNKLQYKEQHHQHLAYKETVKEITGEAPKKKPWYNIFKKKENRPC